MFKLKPLLNLISLLLGIIFFSGIFSFADGILGAFNFITLIGNFGEIYDGLSFIGLKGNGARGGFLFGLTLIPATMLSLGCIEVITYTGGLEAARKYLSPTFRFFLGVPGSSSIAVIASLQSTDAGAGMTKELLDVKEISQREAAILAQFQFIGAGVIGNFFSAGSVLLSYITIPIYEMLFIMLIIKLVSANLMRYFLLKKRYNKI